MSSDANNHGNGHVEALEQRVHRLEDAVAALQDTRQLENRLVERLSRLAPFARPESAGLTIEATGRLVPAARGQVAPQATPASSRPWLLLDAYHEARTVFRMFFDARYRVSRGVLPLSIGLLAAIGTSWLWVPASSLPVFGALWTRLFDLVLAFILFKVLQREARRYRLTFPGEWASPLV
jgi:hypothetical protein